MRNWSNVPALMRSDAISTGLMNRSPSPKATPGQAEQQRHLGRRPAAEHVDVREDRGDHERSRRPPPAPARRGTGRTRCGTASRPACGRRPAAGRPSSELRRRASVGLSHRAPPASARPGPAPRGRAARSAASHAAWTSEHPQEVEALVLAEEHLGGQLHHRRRRAARAPRPRARPGNRTIVDEHPRQEAGRDPGELVRARARR